MIVGVLLIAVVMACDVSPIDIKFEKSEMSSKMRFETNYWNLAGLPIDYDKERAVLRLGFEGGEVGFTNPGGVKGSFKSEGIVFHLPAEHVIDGM